MVFHVVWTGDSSLRGQLLRTAASGGKLWGGVKRLSSRTWGEERKGEAVCSATELMTRERQTECVCECVREGEHMRERV